MTITIEITLDLECHHCDSQLQTGWSAPVEYGDRITTDGEFHALARHWSIAFEQDTTPIYTCPACNGCAQTRDQIWVKAKDHVWVDDRQMQITTVNGGLTLDLDGFVEPTNASEVWFHKPEEWRNP
ncbi:MAG: hypothetical protein AAF125_09670 [Chloroflexota bacterium]